MFCSEKLREFFGKYRNKQETCGDRLQLLKPFWAKPMLSFAFQTSFSKSKGTKIFLNTKKAKNTSYMCVIRLPLCPTQHFGFNSFLFLSEHHLLSHIPLSEATNVLIIISSLVRGAAADEALQTHPCIHTCIFWLVDTLNTDVWPTTKASLQPKV